MIYFFVPGLPAPGGSKRAFAHAKTGRIVVVDDARRNGEWKSMVAWAARQAYHGAPIASALTVSFWFTLPRPKGHTGKRGLLPSAPAYPVVKPDVLKLARSTEDALTGIIWRDDNLTVDLDLHKRYGDIIGCLIIVHEAEAPKEGEK